MPPDLPAVNSSPTPLPPEVAKLLGTLYPGGWPPTSPPPPSMPVYLQKALNDLRADGHLPTEQTERRQPGSSTRPPGSTADAESRAIEYLAKLPPAIQGQRGSSATLWAARCVVWGFDLGEEVGYRLLADHFNPRCEPQWSEAELRRKCADAVRPGFDKARGWLLETPLASSYTPSAAPLAGPRRFIDLSDIVGQGEGPRPDASQCPLMDPPATPTAPASVSPRQGVEDDDPHRLAGLFLERYRHPDGLTLRYWCGEFCVWRNGAYDRTSEADIRNEACGFIEAEFRRLHDGKLKLHLIDREKGDTKKEPVKKKVTTGVVANVLQALKGECGLSSDARPPFWIGGSGPDPAEVISARNGIVHLPAFAAGREGSFTASTPRFFTFNRVRFDFDPAAPPPVKWLAFLNDLWPDDQASVACLQEWFGYLAVTDTSLQKILLLVGPPRAGKGTIARIIRELIGPENITAPRLANLADRFGLQDFIGKTVALIPDARLSGRVDSVAVTEPLLSISGEDVQLVDRKNLPPLTLKLLTRFVLLTNEAPRFADSSAAIIDRFIVIALTKSFRHAPDTNLEQKLRAELPSILLWAIAGWVRLKRNGRFTVPASSAEVVEQMDALASPAGAFIRQRCDINNDPECVTTTDSLYVEWRRWCESRGKKDAGLKEIAIRDIMTAVRSMGEAAAGVMPARLTVEGGRTRGYRGIRILSALETGDIT